jgi:hypothetical protein
VALRELNSKQAVLAAMAEFDRLGRDAFLSQHGYGPARRYFLRVGDRHYDSKAIAGVAYGYQFPARGALKREEFSGGERTVKRVLERLGLQVDVLPLGRARP